MRMKIIEIEDERWPDGNFWGGEKIYNKRRRKMKHLQWEQQAFLQVKETQIDSEARTLSSPPTFTTSFSAQNISHRITFLL